MEKRFDDLFDRGSAKQCWMWKGTTDKQGYGLFYDGATTRRAHRVIYAREVGSVGDLFVLHKCDTPGCVNPAHLWLGTNQDNMTDKVRKGRWRGNQRLAPNEVRLIRHLYARGNVSQTALGKRFGVGQVQISQIMTGKNWSHVK